MARVEGSNHVEVEELLERYQFQNSKLDLFSEASPEPWGDGKSRPDMSRTPRTTNRFVQDMTGTQIRDSLMKPRTRPSRILKINLAIGSRIRKTSKPECTIVSECTTCWNYKDS